MNGVIVDLFSARKEGLIISKRGCPVRQDFVVFIVQGVTGNKRKDNQ